MNKNVIIGCMGCLLLASVATGLYMRYSDEDRISDLEAQLGVLQKQEEKSIVNQRVSQQMEKIAYGQQILSDERSQEAIRQTEIAETERQHALKSQAAAEASAKEALRSYEMAEQQREEADNQRRQAEHAKLVADTLSYISLARTLGSQSYAIYRSGDKELGNMLAYASYLYTKDYGGDLYTTAVFQALIQSAGGRRTWSIHNGRIMGIDVSPKDGSLLTVSAYGEFFVHRMQGNTLKTTQLVNDKRYCFRDVYATNGGKYYAVSHTGHLVVVDGSQIKTILLENITRPFSLENMHDTRLLIVGENGVITLDTTTDKVISTRALNFNIICTGQLDNKPLLFDNRGRMHLVNSIDQITNEKVPVQGQVTAFTCQQQQRAYGMADGTIWLINGNGTPRKLVGHLSRVTKLELIGKRLLSSSYDSKLFFWMTNDIRITPIILFQSNSWLNDFTFSKDYNYIWTGEHNGTISEYLISLPMISQRLRQNVKRNFTQQEWDYYVGKGIPYRIIKSEK